MATEAMTRGNRTAATGAPLARMLRSMADFVEDLDPGVYSSEGELGIGTIGGHVRHAHDHAAALRSGLEEAMIDFDARERGTPVETDPAAASRALRATAAALDGCGADTADRAVVVRMAMSDHKPEVECHSTFGREVVFALGHAVHHAAMIGAIARSLGAEVPEGFGVAASTKRFRAGEERGA